MRYFLPYKPINWIIFLVMMLLFINPSLSWSETDIDSSQFENIFLVDNTPHGVLEDIFKNNVLAGFGIPVSYSRTVMEQPRHGKDITILLTETYVDNEPLIQFTMFTSLGDNTTVKAEWSLPEDQVKTELYSDALQKAIAGTLHGKRYDPHRGITDFYASSDNVHDLKVEYEEDDDSSTTSIRGYTFDVSTTGSSKGKFWRTIGEITALNAIGEVEYYMKLDSNTDDWEYQPNVKGFSQKVADGPAFDANNFTTNVAGHIYSGSLYYTSARSNGYSFFQSTLFTLGGSLMWEYIGEYKERASTNDMIFTTMGGALLGESLTQTSLFVERSFRQSLTRDIVVFLLNPMRTVNQYLDSRSGNSFRVRIDILPPAKDTLAEMASR